MARGDRVEVWFEGFVIRLIDRLDRKDWLDDGTEFWDGIRSRVVHHGIREDEADAASLLLIDNPPEFRNKIWPALLEAFHSIRASREASAPATPDDREAARLASLGCPYCHGQGLLSVSHSRGGDPETHCPPTLTAACVCPAGRWQKTQTLRSLPQGRKAGLIDLTAVLDGSSAYRLAIAEPGFDSLAGAHWETMSYADRMDACGLVVERLVEFVVDHPTWVEGIARGWAYDPSLVVGMPPPARDGSWKRPRFPRVPAVPPAHAPDVARPPDDQKPSDWVAAACQFLVGMLSGKPATYQRVVECAEIMRIKMAYVEEAAVRIGVVKTREGGQDVWGLVVKEMPR